MTNKWRLTAALFIAGSMNMSVFAEQESGPQSKESASGNALTESLSQEQREAAKSGPDTRNIQMGFTRLDVNDNGKLSYGEAALEADLQENFQKYDRNSDEMLDVGEFAAFFEEHNDAFPSRKNDIPGEGEASTPFPSSH